MKTALITGSTGYLGKHLLPALESFNIKCYESNTKEANLLVYENLDCFIGIKFDYIFHLAAWTKAGDFCIKHPFEQWLINEKINYNIIRFWYEQQPNALFVGMGTSCSYDPELEMIEENYLNGQLDKDLFAYAITKKSMLVALQSAHKQLGLNYLYFIPSTIYGPGFSENDSHFIYDLIRKIKNAKNSNNIATLWGNGEQTRDLIFINDLIYSMSAAIFLGNLKNEIFNISSNESFSIKEYAQKICNLLDVDFNKKVKFDPTAFAGVLHKKLNIEKSILFNLHVSRTPFDSAILKLIS